MDTRTPENARHADGRPPASQKRPPFRGAFPEHREDNATDLEEPREVRV